MKNELELPSQQICFSRSSLLRPSTHELTHSGTRARAAATEGSAAAAESKRANAVAACGRRFDFFFDGFLSLLVVACGWLPTEMQPPTQSLYFFAVRASTAFPTLHVMPAWLLFSFYGPGAFSMALGSRRGADSENGGRGIFSDES